MAKRWSPKPKIEVRFLSFLYSLLIINIVSSLSGGAVSSGLTGCEFESHLTDQFKFIYCIKLNEFLFTIRANFVVV